MKSDYSGDMAGFGSDGVVADMSQRYQRGIQAIKEDPRMFAEFLSGYAANVGRETMANAGDHLNLAGLESWGKQTNDYWRSGQTNDWNNMAPADQVAMDWAADPTNALFLGLGNAVKAGAGFVKQGTPVLSKLQTFMMNAWNTTENTTSVATTAKDSYAKQNQNAG